MLDLGGTSSKLPGGNTMDNVLPTLNSSVNSIQTLPQNKNLVTTKELANILNVDISTVKKTVKRLEEAGDVLHYSTNVKGNLTFMYDEKQVTRIKKEIQKHHNLPSRQIDNVSTELEENETILKAFSILKTRNEILVNQVHEMQPKSIVYDEMVDRSKTINFRDMAAKIGFSQNEFMTILKAKYIYKNSIGEYRAYSEYQDLFTLRTFAKGVDKTGEQLMLNMKGITYFCNKYKPGAVAESYIEKSDAEYEKLMNETAGNFIGEYTFDQVARKCNEEISTLNNFCQMQGYLDENLKPTMYGILITGYFTESGTITTKGKNYLVSVFGNIAKNEKSARTSEYAKAE